MIHGGAGALDKITNPQEAEPSLRSIRRILERGQAILRRGGTALDAVETCASLLEDDPLFNAGRGSVLNEHGKVTMDAAIMDGRNLDAGAVAGIHRIVHPIKLARLVLEESDHVMLIGDGALRLARAHKMKLVPESYHITEHRLEEYNGIRQKQRHKPDAASEHKHGTIGAVAMDKKGNLAAAASTGGIPYKKEGRVGDSPIIGAGVYADNSLCAVSATGHGEMFMRTVLAKHIADLVSFRKMGVESAARSGIAYLKRKVNGRGGVIVIDKNGRCAACFNTRTMVHGWIAQDGDIHCAY